MTERWKDVVGYEGLYQVSDYGRLKRMVSIKCKKERIKKPVTTRNGRLSTTLYKNNIEQKMLIHRLVLMSFVGLPEADQITRHLDGNPMNNNLTNLRWGTHKENQQDSIKHGTKSDPPRVDNSGSKNGQSKLTESQVSKIKVMAKAGKYTQREIAEMFGITQQTVSDIHVGRSRSNSNG